MSDFPFSTEDVLSLLGISYKVKGSSVDIKCIACDDRSTHLNINLKKGVFRCNKCGFSGNILTLYGEMTNMTPKEAYHDIMERLRLNDLPKPEIVKRKEIQKTNRVKSEEKENQLAELEKRDHTYSLLLNQLKLNANHYQDLIKRGFRKEEILNNMYRSMPVCGYEQIAFEIQEQGGYMRGVPGFYRRKNDKWSVRDMQSGILIPTLSVNKKIQGLQLRVDEEKRYRKANGNLSPKYLWLSSVDRDEGCRSATFVHFACDFAWDSENKNFYPVLKKYQYHGEDVGYSFGLTEGPLKADLTFAITGLPLIALPGVNQFSSLEKTLKQLKYLGVETIFNLYDMDFEDKEEVQRAVDKVKDMIISMGFRYFRPVWNRKFKGIDDYYAFKIRGIKAR